MINKKPHINSYFCFHFFYYFFSSDMETRIAKHTLLVKGKTEKVQILEKNTKLQEEKNGNENGNEQERSDMSSLIESIMSDEVIYLSYQVRVFLDCVRI